MPPERPWPHQESTLHKAVVGFLTSGQKFFDAAAKLCARTNTSTDGLTAAQADEVIRKAKALSVKIKGIHAA